MNRLFQFLILFCLLMPAGPVAAQGVETIAVVVNEDAITQRDLNDRLILIIRSSGMPDTEETRENLKPQILKTLIDEQIKLQEAELHEITVDQEEIENGFAQIAKQNNMTSDQFKEVLRRSNINIETMFRQIKSQIAWSKVVQSQLRPQINISESDIEDALNRLKGNLGKAEYQLAEIYLPVTDTSEQAQVRKLARQLSTDIRAGKVPFFKVAQQFSKAAGATKGGDLGWVQEGQLDEELDKVLPTLSENSVSDPIRSPAGYHILLLRSKRVMSEDAMPSETELTNELGMERLERLQRQYMMDLKAEAFIENRV